MALTFPAHFQELRQRVEGGLLRLLDDEESRVRGERGRIAAAMRTALAAPAKRLRPLAALVAGTAFGSAPERILPFAMAVELVHTASLVLDDLPCMDDAPVRRGQPALHRRIGEADAILTAFALLSRAFSLAAEVPGAGGRDRELPGRLASLLAGAAGARGMCEGQSLDLAFDPRAGGGLRELEAIHRRKTGALFAAALEGGGLLGGATPAELEALLRYGKNLGLAFQVMDDLLDACGDARRTGKEPGADRGRRLTFVSLCGDDEVRELHSALHRAARSALEPLGGRARSLVELSELLEARDA
ncbi:MAG: polyprenyl synthetase family protein [Planctomycetota bacterium]